MTFGCLINVMVEISRLICKWDRRENLTADANFFKKRKRKTIEREHSRESNQEKEPINSTYAKPKRSQSETILRHLKQKYIYR